MSTGKAQLGSGTRSCVCVTSPGVISLPVWGSVVRAPDKACSHALMRACMTHTHAHTHTHTHTHRHTQSYGRRILTYAS